MDPPKCGRTTDVAVSKTCEFTNNNGDVPHWYCVTLSCPNFSQTDIPNEDTNPSRELPNIKLHV